jgi:hypothetical protein
MDINLGIRSAKNGFLVTDSSYDDDWGGTDQYVFINWEDVIKFLTSYSAEEKNKK